MFCVIRYLWVNHHPGPNSLEGKNHSGKKQDRLADQWQAWNVTVKLVLTALISQMCFKIPHVFRKTESVLLSDATKKSPLSYKRFPLEFVDISEAKIKCEIMYLTYVPFLGRENITSGVIRLPLGKGRITEFKLPFWCRRGKETHPYFCWTHN